MRGVPLLVTVWAVLLGLLAATVGASLVATGAASVSASMALAAAKAALIFWFYMHLRELDGIVRLVAVGAAAWLLLLLVLMAADFATRAVP
ncbi:cytochrome C oxidase subunit IV family protein [Geminicoccaceae bacterium 1502E]|nr:cytochrome C oxidase subunit IV family protein [Geminicoccaceae bacterium 1502E]